MRPTGKTMIVRTLFVGRALFVAALGVLVAAACRSPNAPPPEVAKGDAPRPETHASAGAASAMPLLPGIGMSSPTAKGAGPEDAEPEGPEPACAKDEDCWSKTCCPAAAPEECVHASRARKCAIVDVQCKTPPLRYTCVCDGGACKGRLAPP